MYCGQHGERNVGIADGFIKSPKEHLVDQLMSKGSLGSHLRAGRMTVPMERLKRLEGWGEAPRLMLLGPCHGGAVRCSGSAGERDFPAWRR
jgi:hypothetical protein